MDETTERPLECYECEQKATIKYTRVIDYQIVHHKMCSDCPVLKKYLFQEDEKQDPEITCESCQNSLHKIELGHPMGCEKCYLQFALALQERLASHFSSIQAVLADFKWVHVGREQGEKITIPLLDLNAVFEEALQKAIELEQYEQASWIRHQQELQKGLKPKGEA